MFTSTHQIKHQSLKLKTISLHLCRKTHPVQLLITFYQRVLVTPHQYIPWWPSSLYIAEERLLTDWLSKVYITYINFHLTRLCQQVGFLSACNVLGCTFYSVTKSTFHSLYFFTFTLITSIFSFYLVTFEASTCTCTFYLITFKK